MSLTASRTSKQSSRACRRCRERKARFRYAGTVKADRDHTLCFECFRSERERRRARLLADVTSATPLRLPFDAATDTPEAKPSLRAPLNEREIDHRRRMLAHLGGLR